MIIEDSDIEYESRTLDKIGFLGKFMVQKKRKKAVYYEINSWVN